MAVSAVRTGIKANRSYIGDKYHSTGLDQVEKRLDLSVRLECGSHLFTGRFILPAWTLCQKSRTDAKHKTILYLDIPNEKRPAWSFSVDTLFNNRVVNLVVTMARTTSASGTTTSSTLFVSNATG